MNKTILIGLLFLVLKTTCVFSQAALGISSGNSVNPKAMNPLSPAKAAFYSAVLPGLGQAYNKRYWKIPLIYGAIGVSLYYFIDSNNKYEQYRDAYKRRLEGYTDDRYSYLDNNRLILGQKFYQKNRDLSSFFIIGFYVLNIIDANVDAALLQFNINDNLSFNAFIIFNPKHWSLVERSTFFYNFNP